MDLLNKRKRVGHLFIIYLKIVLNWNKLFYNNCIKPSSTLSTVRGLMMFELDVQSRRPIYEQLMEKFKGAYNQ